MFYLRVEDRHRPEKAPEAASRVVSGEKLRASFISDTLYSFFDYMHPIVLAGEANAPISELDLHRTYKHLSLKGGAHFLSEKILSLVVVNLNTGLVQAFRNISCNRPLYLYKGNDLFVCSTRISAFRDDMDNFRLNEALLPELLVYRFIMPPRTIYKGIKYLPGGWTASLEMPQGDLSIYNLLRPEHKERHISFDDAVETVSGLLRNSLALLKEFGQPATLLLSGGLDSSVLGAFCKNLGIQIDSVSSGFHCITGDPGENRYAQTAAEHLGLEHQVHDISEQDYLMKLLESVKAAEEPLHHLQSVVMASIYSTAVKPQVKYLINGESADMVFGNSDHMNYWRVRRLVKLTDSKAVKILAQPLFGHLARRNGRIDYLLSDHGGNYQTEDHFLWKIGAYGDNKWVKSFCDVDTCHIIDNRRDFLESYEGWPLLDKITLLTLASECDTTMRIWSKLAEQSGRIIVYPFTYPELMFYVMSLDWKIKARQTKFILRNVAARTGFPDEIIYRPKRSFGFPVRYWALPGALFQPLVDMAGEMFDKKALVSLQSPDLNKAMILWSMINYYLLQKIVVGRIPIIDIKEEILSRRMHQEKAPA